MNFIIDLGGVVVTWQPQAIVAQYFNDPIVQARIMADVVGHPDWLELDRGTLARSIAIERAAKRTRVAAEQIEALFLGVPAALVAIPETVALLYRLKVAGHTLYCLSNMHPEFIAYLEETYDFFEVFSDIVVSCRVKMCKPEPAIFDYILTKNALTPVDTLFIDDTLVNLNAATALGIQTLHFKDASQCEQHLQTLGLIQ